MRVFNNYTYLISVALVAAVINTSWATDGIAKQVDLRISDIIAENVLHFGHQVGLELASLDPYATRSEIFSPLSLMAALSLLTLGAKGKSYQELKQILGLDSDSELIRSPNKYHEEFGLMLNHLQYTHLNGDGINKRPNAKWHSTTVRLPPVVPSTVMKVPAEHIIKVANGLFVQNSYSLNPDYSRVLQSIYETELAKLDFQSRSTEAIDYINAWVNKATFGKIPEIIKDGIDKKTSVIIASTLYFKGFWETPFFLQSTHESDFFPDGETNPSIKVQMMPGGGVFPYYDAKEYDCRIIGFPYKGNETTMYIIQPNNSTRQKLRDLQHVLDAHKINGMIDKMERKTTVMVFPKMHFVRTLHMKEILQAMNVRDVFVNGNSDLSLIGQRSQSDSAGANPTPLVKQNLNPEQLTREHVVTYESIHREKPIYERPQLTDRFDEPALIFSSRFGGVTDSCNSTQCVAVNNTMDSTQVALTTEKPSTNVTDYLNKRDKRQVLRSSDNASLSLSNLEFYRQKTNSYKSDLYVDDILHDVDFSVDEQGTEAAAATRTYLLRSGTDVIFRGDTPFLIVIRHDPTKLPLFYGIINKPEL